MELLGTGSYTRAMAAEINVVRLKRGPGEWSREEGLQASKTGCPGAGCSEQFTVDDLADVGVGDLVMCPGCKGVLELAMSSSRVGVSTP